MSKLIENATKIAAAIGELPEIESVNLWSSVAGKERIYIELIRTDRDGKRYGGVGGKCYLDLQNGRLLGSNSGYNGSIYCNSFTKDYHTENGTAAKIRAIVAAI